MSSEHEPCAEPFFPFSCHLAVTRRQLLAGAGVLLGSVMTGRGVARAGPGSGGRVIGEYATAPGDPWAVAHGIRAVGRDFRLRDGGLGVDHLLQHVLTSIPANGRSALGFDLDAEVHPDAFLAEALLEPGVALDHSFTHGGRRRTLRDVVEGARARFRPSQVSSVPNALPWSLIAFTRTTSPVRPRWSNAWGETVDLDAVVENALGLLEEASRPIAEAMRERRPESVKAPVHSFTCGGTHMLYALLTAVKVGYVGTDRVERVRRQVDLLVWRLDADIALIERFYTERAGQRGASWYELDSKLKLLGHAEECLALAERRGLVTLTSPQRDGRRRAVGRVRAMLDELDRRGLEDTRALNRELFKQLIGDVCHARHGLTLV